MSFLISDAFAQQATGMQPGIEGMLFPIGILIFFYFLFLRPQQKRAKEQKQLLASLTKGVEVVTSSGILGKVVDFDENFVKLEVSDNNFIQVQRHAVANLMPKGTYKALNTKKP